MLTFDSKTIETFRKTIYDYYALHGRHDLPWRHTDDPYRILVSEIMLQQTQVPRVIGKYTEFTERFCDIHSLATAPVKDVLKAWQGLGYNRRALMLHKMAGEIVGRFDGEVPSLEEDLLTLPGIGPYTAAAVMAFAFDRPATVIDTNIRSVFIHHFFADRTDVPDSEVIPLVEAALDTGNPRKWYSALMDYGTYLKSSGENPGRRSAHHIRQSPFTGSDRQVRGNILKLLIDRDGMTAGELARALDEPVSRVRRITADLCSEGFVLEHGTHYFLPGDRT